MVSKAELKRQKDARQFLGSYINRTLAGFKEQYLADYVQYHKRKVERRLEVLKESDARFVDGYERLKLIELTQLRLDRASTFTLQYLTEANESYESRVAALVEKLVSFGMTVSRLRVSKISPDFSFIIENNDMTVHARLIYVDGVVVIPHYRFITTKRMKK